MGPVTCYIPLQLYKSSKLRIVILGSTLSTKRNSTCSSGPKVFAIKNDLYYFLLFMCDSYFIRMCSELPEKSHLLHTCKRSVIIGYVSYYLIPLPQKKC